MGRNPWEFPRCEPVPQRSHGERSCPVILSSAILPVCLTKYRYTFQNLRSNHIVFLSGDFPPLQNTTMSSTEDFPTLQSLSIRAFCNHLEDAHKVPSPFNKKAASPRDTHCMETDTTVEHDDDDTELTEASLADIQPRPITSLTVLSRSTLATDLNHHQVLERIEKLIRDKSLNYTFDPENSSIECQTPCNLCFALYLWTNEQGKVLVEVQRRSGSAILMQRVRKALFRILLYSLQC